MENGPPSDVAHEVQHGVNDACDGSARPPPPPDPNLNDAKASTSPSCAEKSDTPLILQNEHWDVDVISSVGALRMLIEAVEKLAENTGDVPPTPPVSRPGTPKKPQLLPTPSERAAKRLSATVHHAVGAGDVPAMEIGSPEALCHEPITVDVSQHAEDIRFQHAAIARRFFSKCAPPFSLRSYLIQIHKHCPHSPGVYLAAAAYIHRLCIVDYAVPATQRTIHRLSLAAIRVAAKSLEDNKWAQARVARVGGVSTLQLLNLEITLCFLLDFDLHVPRPAMAKGIFGLQTAARTGLGRGGMMGSLVPSLRLPPRRIRSGA
ncbi:cyclin-domain-containing protein [Dissoconium aciculare CBS 342.82]|uniref:Cyclin-domain-containing protein n=1 Tax=Dissoconium aciculare CBS 342.82 TaxID=1314786 RepID=A0A6J3LVH2_9PEZI|nr:cyclin-domain-containing protein [Dissoconium aciculare CBS 342.82]KAF1819673.1 cyclin-domain-containing protein [Dissoconium aciculare CBS 342.82]